MKQKQLGASDPPSVSQSCERRLNILVLGDVEQPELADCIAQLRSDGAQVIAGMPHSLIHSAAAAEFELIVVAAAAPGRIAAADVQQLRRAAPLARIAGLLGSWCEGEMRSGKPWPGVPRVYWHQWPQRYLRERTAMLAGKLSGWTLPPSASDEERWQQTAAALGDPIRLADGITAIVAGDLHTYEALADVCHRSGGLTQWSRGDFPGEIGDVRRVLVSGQRTNDAEFARYRQLRQRLPTARIVALMDFPRHDDLLRAHEAGVDAVVSRPFSVDELRAVLFDG